MATYTPAGRSTHPTTAASTVDTITFASDLNAVAVINRGTTGLWYSDDNKTTPVVPSGTAPSGDGLFYCGPGATSVTNPPTSGSTVIQVISSGVVAYSVQQAG